jgi:carboxypeptidase Taq
MPKSPYDKVHSLSKSISLLNAVHSLLDWDQETHMPKDAIALRSEQIEIIASLVHEKKTSKTFAKALFSLIDKETGEIIDSNLTEAQIAALKRWRRDYLQAVKLPNAFVKQFAKTISTSTHIWKTAKEHNDFKSFAPSFEKVVSLSRKKADILGFKEHPYDALLDLYEPDLKTAFLTPLFEKLKLFLIEFLKEIKAKPAFREDFLYRHCPKHNQIDFAHKILHKMGFHPSSSRLDLAVHPFCTGMQPKDTRMTTKIHPENILTNIGAVLHEGGHGLYNMNLPPEHYGSPLCEQVSLGIDESQSRLWETLIGQSESFWRYFFPLLQQEFHEQFGNIHFDEFYPAINSVKPSLIRIEADEVTYNLHIIIRFEIEKALIEGSLKVKDVPDAWNSKMREYLGISPEFDGQGCLQDIHWSLGYIGYFPTYTMGNLYAAQFFEAFEKEHPGWQDTVARGGLNQIRDFLKEKIHRHGRTYLPGELCERVTGKPLSEEPYIKYLTQKYKKLYHL